mmetsp:Transcript_30119/g.51769  ORF Transcript_30119/g.51769 Transcript_30119/m.51769 type:complete len:319 (-) Transcript_30119:69-1025(-)
MAAEEKGAEPLASAAENKDGVSFFERWFCVDMMCTDTASTLPMNAPSHVSLTGHLQTVRLAKYLGVYEQSGELVNDAPIYVKRREGTAAVYFLYRTSDGGGHWMATPEMSYIPFNGGALATARPSELPTDPGLKWKFADKGAWQDCPDTKCEIADPPEEQEVEASEETKSGAGTEISYAEQLYEVAETLYGGLEAQALGAGDDEYQRDFQEALFCPPQAPTAPELSAEARKAQDAKAKARLVLAAVRWESAAKLGHGKSKERLEELEEQIKAARGESAGLIPLIQTAAPAETVDQIRREQYVADYIAAKISEHEAKRP